MKKLTCKFIPKITIKQIALSGIFLALITAFKLLDIAMPKINDNAMWELYYTIGALMVIALPLIASFLVLLAAPFLWLAIGQIVMSGPWSMFFDYCFPLFGLLIIKASINRYFSPLFVLLAGLIKFFSHTISGKLFWETPWWPSMVYNFPFTAITVSITIVVVFALFPKIKAIGNVSASLSVTYYISQLTKRYVSEYTYLQKGYLNKTALFEIDNKKWIIKVANSKAKTLETEFQIARAFYPDSLLSDDKKALLRPYIEGQTVKVLNEHQRNDLVKKIEMFHQIKNLNLQKQNWNEYNHFGLFINKNAFGRFKMLVEKYKDETIVPCHHDLNLPNLLCVSEKEVALIDFEWARLDSAIFDYASFYLYENIYLKPEHQNDDKFHDYVFINLVYGILWTYSVPVSWKAWKIRKNFKEKLNQGIISRGL